MNENFVVRYKELDPHLIYNLYGPAQALRFGPDDDGSEYAKVRINRQNEINGFYDKLEASILKEGVRNPILISAGRCRPSMVSKIPKEMREDHTKILVLDRHGGSRLWAAQKHNLTTVPCIISDFVDMFPECPVLETVDEIRLHYQDQPKELFIERENEILGVVVKGLPMTHL